MTSQVWHLVGNVQRCALFGMYLSFTGSMASGLHRHPLWGRHYAASVGRCGSLWEHKPQKWSLLPERGECGESHLHVWQCQSRVVTPQNTTIHLVVVLYSARLERISPNIIWPLPQAQQVTANSCRWFDAQYLELLTKQQQCYLLLPLACHMADWCLGPWDLRAQRTWKSSKTSPTAQKTKIDLDFLLAKRGQGKTV